MLSFQVGGRLSLGRLSQLKLNREANLATSRLDIKNCAVRSAFNCFKRLGARSRAHRKRRKYDFDGRTRQQ